MAYSRSELTPQTGQVSEAAGRDVIGIRSVKGYPQVIYNIDYEQNMYIIIFVKKSNYKVGFKSDRQQLIGSIRDNNRNGLQVLLP